MTDGDLLIFGCAVSFVALCGAYVYVREGFTANARPARAQKQVGERGQPKAA
ncbi:MAG TPA: hypothetical protein VIY27_14065 [Myxococcota bacterium]